jgi:hypothetical protein
MKPTRMWKDTIKMYLRCDVDEFSWHRIQLSGDLLKRRV